MTTTGRPRHAALDATRGLALLGSAVGTALLWLGGRQLGAGYRPVGGSDLDRVADLVTALLVDNRVLAVFALLLGHGLAVQLHRARRSGPDPDVAHDAASAVALRRAAGLVLLGAAHAALVLDADVLSTLGVLLVLTLPLVRARTRTHVVVGLLVVPALLVHGVADGLGGTVGLPDPPTDYLLSVVDRVGTWLLALVLLPFSQVGLLLAVVAGVRLARGGWLLEPDLHRRGLLVLGAVSSVVGLLGAWPYAQVVTAGFPVDVAVSVPAGVLSAVTGPAGALGAVCLGVLLVDRLTGPGTGTVIGTGAAAARRPLVALRDGVAATGRCSLPVYLAHSVLLAAVLAPWAGGAGTRWGSAAVAALAVGLWVLTVVVAAVVVAAVAQHRGDARGGDARGGDARGGDARGDGSGGGRGYGPTDRQGLARSSAT
ncbi:DUF418 domain-containing protein [Aquipuribacter sp. MA13-6]|uniref:DUF418 domain-containing protein n=1 Tax=unclassified Aquipuribacter TaxID=2635084 RepID=UPI003EEB2794